LRTYKPEWIAYRSRYTENTDSFSKYEKSGIMTNEIKVTLVKSGIGKNKRIRETLKGLGLTKLNKTVNLKNTPAIRGMINKVSFMVKVEV